jgi:hypothetical protein
MVSEYMLQLSRAARKRVDALRRRRLRQRIRQVTSDVTPAQIDSRERRARIRASLESQGGR